MTGTLLILFGLACALAGWLLLRRGGSGWRVGRLLSAAPQHDLYGKIGRGPGRRCPGAGEPRFDPE